MPSRSNVVSTGNLFTQAEGTKTTVYLPGEQLTIDTSTSPATLSGVRFYDLPGGITAVRTGSSTAYGFEIASDQHGTNTLYLDYTAQSPTWRQFDPYGNPRGTAPATGFPGSRGFLNDPTDLARPDSAARDSNRSIGPVMSWTVRPCSKMPRMTADRFRERVGAPYLAAGSARR